MPPSTPSKKEDYTCAHVYASAHVSLRLRPTKVHRLSWAGAGVSAAAVDARAAPEQLCRQGAQQAVPQIRGFTAQLTFKMPDKYK